MAPADLDSMEPGFGLIFKGSLFTASQLKRICNQKTTANQPEENCQKNAPEDQLFHLLFVAPEP